MLDILVQRRRNRKAADRLLRKLLGTTGIHPEAIVTDKLASYRAALREHGGSNQPSVAVDLFGASLANTLFVVPLIDG